MMIVCFLSFSTKLATRLTTKLKCARSHLSPMIYTFTLYKGPLSISFTRAFHTGAGHFYFGAKPSFATARLRLHPQRG